MAGRGRPRKQKFPGRISVDDILKKQPKIPKNETPMQTMERMARERYELQCRSAGIPKDKAGYVAQPQLHLREEWFGAPKKHKGHS
jgi:hypothetical protein